MVKYYDDFTKTSVNAFCSATKRTVLPLKENISINPPKLLIRVGIIGTIFGGHCFIEIPLLTALNFTCFNLWGQNFLTLNSDTVNEEKNNYRKILLGIKRTEESEFYIIDKWTHKLAISLGTYARCPKIELSMEKENPNAPHGLIRLRLGNADGTTVHSLDKDKQTTIDLLDRYAFINAIDSMTLSIVYDEAHITLYENDKLPEGLEPIITYIDGEKKAIRAPGNIIKSQALELANQVASNLLPADFIGDISTPTIISERERDLHINGIEKFKTNLLITTIGNLSVEIQLCRLKGLKPVEEYIIKSMFNFVYAHPALKELFKDDIQYKK